MISDFEWRQIEEENSLNNSKTRIDWIEDNILGDSVADIGGAGGDQFPLRKNNGHNGPFLLVDDLRMIQEGLERNPGVFKWHALHLGRMDNNTFCTIPEPDNSYDTVIMGDMLEHNSPIELLIILKEGIRIAKKRVLITTPNAERIGRQPFCIIAGHTTFMTPSIFRNILDNPDVLDHWYNRIHPEWKNNDKWWDRNRISYTINEDTEYILLCIDKI
jgi:hypothetical protein